MAAQTGMAIVRETSAANLPATLTSFVGRAEEIVELSALLTSHVRLVWRADARNHRLFGGGIHYCVGAPLARLETEIAINSLRQRWPGLRLVDERPQWRFNFIFGGLQRLMVEAGR